LDTSCGVKSCTLWSATHFLQKIHPKREQIAGKRNLAPNATKIKRGKTLGRALKPLIEHGLAGLRP
jgi:hypothetical protein